MKGWRYEGYRHSLAAKGIKTNLAVVGFSPDMHERILRVLAQNPQLKSKVEAGVRDIVAGTTSVETGRPVDVSSWAQVWWATESRDQAVSALNDYEFLKEKGLSIPSAVQEALEEIPGKTIGAKRRYMRMSAPWTIYLSKAVQSGKLNDPRLKALIAQYGYEVGMDEYIRSLLEHETTHIAHGEKIPDFLDKMLRERGNVLPEVLRQAGRPPVSAFRGAKAKVPDLDLAIYLSEPSEQLARAQGHEFDEREKTFSVLSEKVPALVERRRVWEEMLRKSPKKLRQLPRKWIVGEGEEELFSPREEEYSNLAYLE